MVSFSSLTVSPVTDTVISLVVSPGAKEADPEAAV
jgi:hypothetical protein